MSMGGLAFVVGLVAVTAALAVIQLSPLEDPAAFFLPDTPPESSGTHVRIEKVQRLGEGKLTKPEDVAADADGKFLYVGCEDGWIRRVERSSGHVEDWAHIIGGRPLGLAIGPNGPHELIVCEPKMGLLNVNRSTIEVLSVESEGLKFKLTDAAVVSKNGASIFFTDASHKYSLENYIFDLLEARPNGRLLKYDHGTRTTITLMESLYFANGVALSANEDFLVVCESTIARCQKYWLKGDKIGHAEIFVDKLPAFPDNIKSDGKGHFWISLILNKKRFSWIHRFPFLKRIFALVPKTLIDVLRTKALVLVVDEEGNTMFTLNGPISKTISFVTTALPIDNTLYMGNLGNDFLGQVNLNNLVQ